MSTYTAISYKPLPILKTSLQKSAKKQSGQPKLRWTESAVNVFIDFNRYRPLEINQNTDLKRAEELIDATRSRYACVLDDTDAFVGVLPKKELHGRKSINLARELGVAHGKLTADYLMIPIAKLPVISLQQLQNAKIGDVVATLHKTEQDYLLVLQDNHIVGMIPALRIVELTGESVQIPHHASSFAEIMTVVRHREAIE